MNRRTAGVCTLLIDAGACSAGARAQEAPQTLPLRDVVLFSSGVGYFQREGQVTGDATLDLSFRAEQVNDILKSLVLLDPQGTVRPVSYTTQDALSRRLKGIGQGLNSGVSLGALLRQFQGARVRLETGGEAVDGRILSVSQKPLPVKDAGVVQTDVLNVLTDDGLRAIVLDQISKVKLLDERLDRELRESLELLATGLDEQRRRVELRFSGNGPRVVRAGYLQEMPVWKTSYRLVLDKDQRPYLQGWGIIENTTDEDWRNVRLSLVSGRPISFIQDLYQPLYIPRPVIQAQLVGSPLPQTYGETLEENEDRQAGPIDLDLRGVPLREAVARVLQGSGLEYSIDPNLPNVPITLRLQGVSPETALRMVIRQAAGTLPGLTHTRDGDIYVIRIRPPQAPPMMEEAPPEFTIGRGRFGAGGLGGGFGLLPPGTDDKLGKSLDSSLIARKNAGMAAQQFAQSVAAQAQGTERGDVFEYAINQPVTLTRGQAAMVPIVSERIEGERLSIYDPSSDGRRALHGFRLKNTTGLHLAGGPITVFRDGVYAGDAQINNVQPAEDRLLSYAVDLDLVVDHEQPKFRQETVSVVAKSGVLHITRKQQREHVYTFRNKGDEAKTVLIQQDKEAEFKLLDPAKPVETTADEYRFKLDVAPKKTSELKVVTERPVTETIALLNAPVNLLTVYAQNAEVSEKLRGALKDLIAHRRKVTDLQAQRAALEAEIKSITVEQDRIRQNMAQLDRNNALYQQYVKKLTDQEARIERIREEQERLRQAEQAAQKELQAFVDGLTVD